MYFEDRITIRIRKEDLDIIEDIVSRDGGERFDNISHFIRVAALQKVRYESMIDQAIIVRKENNI